MRSQPDRVEEATMDEHNPGTVQVQAQAASRDRLNALLRLSPGDLPGSYRWPVTGRIIRGRESIESRVRCRYVRLFTQRFS
tara:strand:- start:6780 stop:7022 length:243 start_codon:yes stop_codon:yes gene_type:complete